MKRFISMILAAAMLAVPVDAQGDYSKEELVARAKEVCDIGEYEDFNITSSRENKDVSVYYMRWSDEKKGELSIGMGDDGLIYSYYKYNKNNEGSGKVYKDTEARAAAESFLKKVLGDKFASLEFEEGIYSQSDAYVFNYTVCYEGIKTNHTVNINVDKHTNEVLDYNAPDNLISASYGSFDGAKSLDDAKAKIGEGLKIGYKKSYDYEARGKREENVSLIYKFDDYSLYARDLSPVEEYEAARYSNKYAMDEAASADSGAMGLTPEEIKEVEGIKNVITKEEAYKIVKNAFDVALPENMAVEYYKDDNEGYTLNLSSNNNGLYYYITIDAKGRITYFSQDSENEINADSTEKDYSKKAEEIIKKANSSNYELTPLEYEYNKEADLYNYYCNVARNGYESFDEGIALTLDSKGNVCSYNAAYIDDEKFSEKPDVKINRDKALEIAFNNVPFDKCYFVNIYENNDYDGTPVYSFDYVFALNADTGEIVDADGKPFKDNNEIKEYKDIANQWYADAAVNLAYLGYTFEGDEFKGDEPLTVKAFNELVKNGYSSYINEKNYKEDYVLSRYDMAMIFMDIMNCKDYKYNEIFIKPFDDVDFEYTGAIAILKAMGIAGGDSFRGNDAITRGEAAAMIYRFLLNNNNIW